MMPCAPNARTSASPTSHGRISQYTPISRTRRAISWVYCAPKSTIRMRWAWMSGGRSGTSGRRSADAVIGRFLGDRDVVHVALAHASARDPHELRPRAHLLDVIAAGVAHRRPQPAGELVQDRNDAALVGHTTLDTLGNELLELRRRVLEVPVARSLRLRHRAEGPHAAVGLVRGALVELHLARRLLGAGKEPSNHHAVRAGGDRLGDVAREAYPAVCDQRHSIARQRRGDVAHGADLRHTDASHDARGTD